VDARSGAAEIVGLADRALIERFSKRSEQIDWLAEQGLSGIKASSAAAVATRAPKDHGESEQSVYQRWARELAEQGLGERELAAVCRGERGRSATHAELDAALTQVEAAADRFLEERAVRVGRDRRLGVDRFSTPELLALERHLVNGATAVILELDVRGRVARGSEDPGCGSEDPGYGGAPMPAGAVARRVTSSR
jgi:TrwC relaxase